MDNRSCLSHEPRLIIVGAKTKVLAFVCIHSFFPVNVDSFHLKQARHSELNRFGAIGIMNMK